MCVCATVAAAVVVAYVSAVVVEFVVRERGEEVTGGC